MKPELEQALAVVRRYCRGTTEGGAVQDALATITEALGELDARKACAR